MTFKQILTGPFTQMKACTGAQCQSRMSVRDTGRRVSIWLGGRRFQSSIDRIDYLSPRLRGRSCDDTDRISSLKELLLFGTRQSLGHGCVD
jgi:hypothetical protein